MHGDNFIWIQPLSNVVAIYLLFDNNIFSSMITQILTFGTGFQSSSKGFGSKATWRNVP